MSVTLDDDDEVIPGLLDDGRPDPAYAASLGIVPAPLGRRAAAFAIDATIYLLLLLPIFIGALPRLLAIIADEPSPTDWPSHPDFVATLIFWAVGQGLVAVFTIVQLALHGMKGITVGKALLGIKSVNVATFTKPGFWRIVLRAIVLACAFTIVPYLGAVPFLLSPLWDPDKRGRGWLDRLGKNWLIDVRRGLDPFDAKAFRHAKRALSAPNVTASEALPSLATGTAWAGPTFVPAARSSSGVVSLSHPGEVAGAWEPPPIATAATDSGGAGVIAEPEPAPASPPAPQARTATPAPLPQHSTGSPARSATMAFNDGLRFDFDGTVLVGRNPEARNGERLLQIDDPAKQLSKTHLAAGLDEGRPWISDQGSSNGTFVTDTAGRTDALVPFVKTYILAGSVVAVGDRTFVVTPKDAL